MAEVAVAGEVERARCERVGEVVANVCWVVLAFLCLFPPYTSRRFIGVDPSVHSARLRRDVLILGSFPGPLALFSMRAVDEKFDVEAGVLVAAHCVTGVRKIEAAALNGRKTGRKDERFMMWVTAAQLQWR